MGQEKAHSRKILQPMKKLTKLGWGKFKHRHGETASTTRLVRKYKSLKRLINPTHKLAWSIAKGLLQQSTHEVLKDLGIISLGNTDNPEKIITPEITQSIGHLVSYHALCLANDYATTYKADGDEQIAADHIIGLMGLARVDVKIKQGEGITASVAPKSFKKRKTSKSSKTSEAKTGASTEVSKEEKDGLTSVIKDKNGTTIINFHFDIHIDVDVLHHLYVNPQEVNNYLESQTASLKEAIEKKLIEAKLIDQP